MTSRQLSLVQDFTDFEWKTLQEELTLLAYYVMRREDIDFSGSHPQRRRVAFIQAPSPWPFCPSGRQLTLPFWRAILSTRTCEDLATADKTAISLRPQYVQDIARQESLYAANVNVSESRTRRKPIVFYRNGFLVVRAGNGKKIAKLDVGNKSEAE